jgi:hypothetical protein
MPLERILFSINLSKDAQSCFENAYALACQPHAKLFVLHTHENSFLRTASNEGLLRSDSTDEELQNAVQQPTEQHFSKRCAGFDLSAVPIEYTSRRGDRKSC